MIHAQHIARNKRLLMQVQRNALSYFLDNQLEHGLILDRQTNRGALRVEGLCSTSATGMGLIAIALASTPEYGLISRKDAAGRLRKALDAAHRLPHNHGIMPHFTKCDGVTPVGSDQLATIDSAWLIAGGLLAAQFPWLKDCRGLARQLFDRVDWRFWTVAARLGDISKQPGDMNDTLRSRADGDWLLHGARDNGTFLPSHWDLLNAETAFMYALATGGRPGRGVRTDIWGKLKALYDTTGGDTSRGFGLFVHQYSIELINFSKICLPDGFNLQSACRAGVERNYRVSRAEGGRFKTFRVFWGLSAGDGPPAVDGGADEYRAYGPSEPPSIDGTAHVMATVASVRLAPHRVLENMCAAQLVPGMFGRYGYSNVNLDRNWLSRDVVGIDAGAAVMALDNALHGNRLPEIFHRVPPIQSAIARLQHAWSCPRRRRFG